MILTRLSRALNATTLEEALEKTGLADEEVETEAGDLEPMSTEICERMVEDLRLARSFAENSLKGIKKFNQFLDSLFCFPIAGCYSKKRRSDMENAVRQCRRLQNISGKKPDMFKTSLRGSLIIAR